MTGSGEKCEKERKPEKLIDLSSCHLLALHFRVTRVARWPFRWSSGLRMFAAKLAFVVVT